MSALQVPVLLGRVDPWDEMFLPRSPSLPTEIWQMAFRLATEIPHVTDLAFDDTFNHRPADSHEFRTRYFESLKTKIAISLVSHMWRDMITPYLFEVILLNRNTILSLVPAPLDPLNGRERCGYIRRMEVAFGASRNPTAPELPVFFEHLEGILSRCSKLEVFRHSGPARMPSDKVVSFLQHCGSTLRHLYLDGMYTPPDFAKLLNTQCSQLRSLHIVNAGIGSGSFGERISLPSLRTLTYKYDPDISNVPTSFSQGHYPKLRCMKYWFCCYGAYPSYPTLLPSQASKIRTLDMSRGWELPPVLRMLSTHPHVDTLILPVSGPSSWGEEEFFTMTHNHLRRIAIWNPYTSPNEEALAKVFTRFSDTAHFPSVEHFRLLGLKPSKAGKPSFWKQWIAKMEDAGIILDYESGQTVRSLLETEDLAPNET